MPFSKRPDRNMRRGRRRDGKPAGREPAPSPLIVRRHPDVGRDLALLCQLHHVHGRCISPLRPVPCRGFGLTEQFGAAVCAEKLQIDISSRRIRLLPVTESVVLPPFSWRGTMPAFQSVPDLGLSRKYHLKAIGCEICAEHATNLTTEQQWHGLAVQWHSMADQAAKILGDGSQHEFE